MIGVILCGGSGTRLYPLSTSLRPKQFCSFDGGATLLQRTIIRLIKCGCTDIVFATGAGFRELIEEDVSSLSFDVRYHYYIEKKALNTGPAIVGAALFCSTFSKNAPLVIVSSDNYFEDEIFRECVMRALPYVNESVVLLGIEAREASPQFGYVLGDEGGIKSFREKPTEEVAHKLISEGWMWNSGTFISGMNVIIEETDKYAREVLMYLCGMSNVQVSIPFDKMVMEKTTRGRCIKYGGKWSDVGNWKEVFTLQSKNVINEDDDEIYNLAGEEICIVKANGVVLVMKKGEDVSNQVKEISKKVLPPFGSQRSLYVNGGAQEIILLPHKGVYLRGYVTTVKGEGPEGWVEGEITNDSDKSMTMLYLPSQRA